MAKEKIYVVLEGQRYVGKHKRYFEGEEVPESEIFDGTLGPSINGTKDKTTDKGGLILGKPAKLELKGGGKAGRPSGKDEK